MIRITLEGKESKDVDDLVTVNLKIQAVGEVTEGEAVWCKYLKRRITAILLDVPHTPSPDSEPESRRS